MLESSKNYEKVRKMLRQSINVGEFEKISKNGNLVKIL